MKKIFLWGTGSIAKYMLQALSEYIFKKYDIIGFIDNDEFKHGKFLCEKEIFSPDVLYKYDFDYIVILNANYDEINLQVKNMNPKWMTKKHMYFLEQAVLNRYKDSDDKEIDQVLNYIKNNELKIFNYDFTEQCERKKVEVFETAKQRNTLVYYYVKHNNKPMYFDKRMKPDEITQYYKSIIIEQDPLSPHRYLSDDFQVPNNAVVVDAGVAEGNFSLEIIDKIKKLYIVECDDYWIEALKLTFADYSDKVVFINKYLTSYDDGIYAKLDSIIQEPIDFIKMDIEGNEYDALLGAKNLIYNSPNIKCAVCAYHREYDELIIKNLLTEYGLSVSTTNGYMWYPKLYEEMPVISTKLVRGIVRGYKQ